MNIIWAFNGLKINYIERTTLSRIDEGFDNHDIEVRKNRIINILQGIEGDSQAQRNKLYENEITELENFLIKKKCPSEMINKITRDINNIKITFSNSNIEEQQSKTTPASKPEKPSGRSAFNTQSQGMPYIGP